MQTVYVDLLFLINFSMDFLCMLLVSKIIFRRLSYPRAILGAVIGGIYSVAILFMPPIGRLEIIPDLLCCLLMCLTVFAKKEDGLKRLFSNTVTYTVVSMLLGGIMTATFNLLNSSGINLEGAGENDIPPWLLLTVGASAFFATFAGGRFLRRRARETTAEISVTLGGKSLTVNAMYDSGNLLKDCVSGRPVIVIDESHIPSLFEGLKKIDVENLELLDEEAAERISIIPYSTASGEKTMVAFRPKKLTVSSEGHVSEKSALVGFAKINRAYVDCSAIIPTELL